MKKQYSLTNNPERGKKIVYSLMKPEF